MMLAAATKVQECALSKQEATALATAIQNVARHYPSVKATQQTIDWLMLIGVAATVYAPRVMAYNVRVKKAKAQREASVTPIRPNAGPFPSFVDPNG